MSVENENLENQNVKNENVEKGNVEKENGKLKTLKKHLIKKIIIGIIILLAVLIVVIGIKKFSWFDSKTTKIGFENIGEFATQTAYCTTLASIDDSKDFFGTKIPFTQSKYIYSYDIVIKAGFNFEDIEWEKNDTKIEVKLPEVKILSSEIDLDSFKLYHEQESIFNKITMQENNDSLKLLKETSEKDAIANGLLKNARANAETLLTSFFGNVYDLEEYEIVFKDK